MNNRDPFFDFLKGFAIIGVVAIHTFPGIESNVLEKMLRLLMNISVPIFLMVSGYFLGKKNLNTKAKCILFEKNQITKIYIPMLLWSLPYLAYSIYKSGFSFKYLIQYFIGGYSIYYFIALIIQCYLLLPFIQKHISNKLVYFAILINYLGISVLYYLMVIKDFSLPLIVYAGPFPIWILSFVLGVYFSKYKSILNNYTLLILLLISIIGMYLESTLTNTFGILRFSWPLYSFSFLSLVMQNKNKSFSSSLLVYLGNISFMIYLTHMFFVPISSKLYQHIGYNIWLLSVLTVLLFSVCFIRFIQVCCSCKYYKYIGCWKS